MVSPLSILLLVAASPLLISQATCAKAQSKQILLSSIVERKQPSVQKRRQAHPTPKKIAFDIEQSVREELSFPKRERLEHWDFTLDSKNKSLYVTEVGSPLSLNPDDPYMLPFDAQYNVEYLAQFLQSSIIPVSIWKPRLKVTRNEIYQTIVALDSIKNRERLLANLKSRANRIDYQLEGLKDFIIKFYQDKGYNVNLSFGGSVILPVPVATEPAGGTIRVMKYLNYRKCLVFRIPRNLWPWLTLNQDKASFLGRYRYFVSWPDGRTAEGDMQAEYSRPVVFRPLQ